VHLNVTVADIVENVTDCRCQPSYSRAGIIFGGISTETRCCV